ncbi:MAG: YihY/virulence factor BrkB family protein, partial [Roseburia sp.]|nr:YihY/virulence factor BrkB family protein [Roseburia sp.]
MVFRMIIEIKRFTDKCKKDNINAFAAQSAFFLIISLIPFVMVFCSLLQYTPVSESTLLKIVSDIMPAYISPVVVPIIDEFYNKSIGIVSLTAVLAVWSAAKGVQYMADGLNVVNNIHETRNWVVLRFWAVVYMIGFILALLAVIVLLVFGNSIQKMLVGYFPFLAHATDLVFRLRSVIMLAVLIVMFTVLYKTLPNNKEIRDRKLTFKNQLPGGIVCGLAWYVFSFGISVYVDYFNGFSMYGSLTTIVLVMLWLYFCMYIMMLCGE